MKSWLYLAACLVVPQLWAVALARGLAYWTRRRQRAAPSPPPGDYSI